MTYEPREVDGLPVFSSSEEVAYKTCKLAHHFEYVLGFRPIVTNRKLSVGIGVHEALEVYYKGGSLRDIERRLHEFAEERWAELVDGALDDDPVAQMEYIQDRALILSMVERYIKWVRDEGLDDDYETVEVEAQHYVRVPGAPCLLPIKLDLLQRHKPSGFLRVVDFKTRASFYNDTSGYQLSEQNGNYQLGVMAIHGERPTELAYRELRKIVPSGRSKPPYFREVRVALTKEEMLYRARAYAATARQRFGVDPEQEPIANPSSCCGSWKADYKAPCLKVHQGMTPIEALDTSDKFARKDPYERYDQGAE